MVQEIEIVEVDIDGRSFRVRPASPDVLRSGNVVATALAESLDKPSPWAVRFFFGSYAETQYGTTHARGDDVASLVTPYSAM